MLGVAFVITLIFALFDPLCWFLVLGIVLLWLGKMHLDDRRSGESTKSWKAHEAERLGKEIMRFGIRSSLEVYSPEPLADGGRYKVVVQGKDSYLHQHSSQGWGSADMDAVYLMGGQQYSRHEGLLFDGRPAVLCEEDPHKHCYSFSYSGTGRHMSILLRIPPGHRSNSFFDRPLQVSIRTLSAAEEAEVKAIEDKRQREAAEMQREELNRRALELATAAYLGSNFLSEVYQQNYARKFTSKVLDRLGPDWLAEYREVQADVALSAIITEQHPHIMPYLEARLEVIRIAERVAAEPTPPPSASERKPRLSPEEKEAKFIWKRQQILDTLRVHAEDEIAKKLQRFELAQQLRERAQEMHLDEDEIDRLAQELLGDLDQDEDDHSNGYRQL